MIKFLLIFHTFFFKFRKYVQVLGAHWPEIEKATKRRTMIGQIEMRMMRLERPEIWQRSHFRTIFFP